MSSHNLNLNFTIKGQTFDFDLIEGPATAESITLDGHTYSLQGSDCSRLRSMVPELSSAEGLSSSILKDRLWSLKARNIQLVDKASAVALAHLPSPARKGNVVILIGHSSAGKTTVIDAITALEPNRAELGGDRTPAERIYRYVAKHYKEHGIAQEDWEFLHKSLVPEKGDWQIHKAMFGEYTYKPGLSKADQTRVQEIATSLRKVLDRYFETHKDSPIGYTVNKSLELAQKGTDVVFDIVKPEDIPEDPLKNGLSIKYVLVYCPFHTLSQRVANRNRQALESGRTQELRSGTFPLIQFSELFGPRKASDSDGDVIDRVTKKMVEDDFNLHFDAGIEAMRKNDPKALENLDVEKERIVKREKLLNALGFQATDPSDKTIELTPRHQYDLLINTNDPSLGATPSEKGRSAATAILSL